MTRKRIGFRWARRATFTAFALVSALGGYTIAQAQTGTIHLSTPPVYFFHNNEVLVLNGGEATCTAVNDGPRTIQLTTRMFIADDDTAPLPYAPLRPITQRATLRAGEMTFVTTRGRGITLDANMIRCRYEYVGDAKQVVGTIILEDVTNAKAITAQTQIVRIRQ